MKINSIIMQSLLKPLLLISCIAITYQNANAQLGINTSKPKSTLDVNGDLFIRQEIRMGGTNTTAGNAGSVGQVLVSQGNGLPPAWRGVSVPFMEDKQYKLINTYLKSDQVGIASANLDGVATTPAVSSVGEKISTIWNKIPGLSFNLDVKSASNNITYQLQSGVELQTNATGKSVRYICGIFKNDLLVALRPDALTSIDSAPIEGIYTLNYTESNIPVGTYVIDVACRKIYTSDQTNNKLSIGVNILNTNNQSNAFALKSILKVDVAELVMYTN